MHVDLQGTAFPFQPGQAVWIGAHGQDLRKPYSIASSPEDVAREGRLELLVGLDEDGEPGTHLPLVVGTQLDIDGPVGRFTFPDPTRRVALSLHRRRDGDLAAAVDAAALAHPAAHPAIGVMYSARLLPRNLPTRRVGADGEGGTIELRMTVTRDASPGDWTGRRGRITRADLPAARPCMAKRFASYAGRRHWLTKCRRCSSRSVSREGLAPALRNGRSDVPDPQLEISEARRT